MLRLGAREKFVGAGGIEGGSGSIEELVEEKVWSNNFGGSKGENDVRWPC